MFTFKYRLDNSKIYLNKTTILKTLKTLDNFISVQNKKTKLFTPGPGSLLKENIIGLRPCFGRNDKKYSKIEKFVLKKINRLSGQDKTVALQGSGSLAIEIMCLNFLYGNVTIVNTGYYSDRLNFICNQLKKIQRIKSVNYIDLTKLKISKKKIDWIFYCPTETSIGLHIPIKEIWKIAKKNNSKLMLDATASIGLEKNHSLAHVLSFSSCKGLFGLTGASFISYKVKPRYFKNSFYLNLESHENKKMTGPYHTICSLYEVLKNYNKIKQSVLNNKKIFLKKMKNYLIYPKKNQPKLCTRVSKKLSAKNKDVILYKSRMKINGSVVNHLGELHLKKSAKGKILELIN